MHLPNVNVEKRPIVLHEFIRENPLGILTTALESEFHPFLQSSHIPWARAILENYPSSLKLQTPTILERDVLVLFNGPVHHYVTPQFYKQTKPGTGKVVPTWDYEAMEVYGKAKVYFDTKSAEFGAFLTKLNDLSERMEVSVMGYGKTPETHPWKVADAPVQYVELLTKNIIGIEIEITSMSGRFKWSQEKPEGDRAGVIEGFKSLNTSDGSLLSEKVTERAALFDAKAAKKLAIQAPAGSSA